MNNWSIKRGSSKVAIARKSISSILANFHCNDVNIPFFMPHTPMLPSFCCEVLSNTQTKGMITEIGAVSAEIFFVISSTGVKTLINLLAISS